MVNTLLPLAAFGYHFGTTEPDDLSYFFLSNALHSFTRFRLLPHHTSHNALLQPYLVRRITYVISLTPYNQPTLFTPESPLGNTDYPFFDFHAQKKEEREDSKRSVNGIPTSISKLLSWQATRPGRVHSNNFQEGRTHPCRNLTVSFFLNLGSWLVIGGTPYRTV